MEVKMVGATKFVYYNDWRSPIYDSGSGRLSSNASYFSWGRYVSDASGEVTRIDLPLDARTAPIRFQRVNKITP